MANRPTDNWRAWMTETGREIAAGTLAPECAGEANLYPESLLRATDAVLKAFEDEVRALQEASDEVVFGTVEGVVLALNAIDGDGQHGGAGFCTEEREQLCEYIDSTLSEHGVDVAALAARRGIDRSEITDRWRDC
ncbi:hypothetical protein [Streptomyces deccanensis]|uniref:hypothetical protein n=1 Tax=Streptomyces deccanensis TaxID=424188 RepID=UPI001EFA843A|nr:hypothetical protein [Streptomyces deccanensis]ULR50708.1 hypothetical protein L3078_16150 [Streptomyces deccanensis]